MHSTNSTKVVLKMYVLKSKSQKNSSNQISNDENCLTIMLISCLHTHVNDSTENIPYENIENTLSSHNHLKIFREIGFNHDLLEMS